MLQKSKTTSQEPGYSQHDLFTYHEALSREISSGCHNHTSRLHILLCVKQASNKRSICV